jgi:hypothetical protein
MFIVSFNSLTLAMRHLGIPDAEMLPPIKNTQFEIIQVD